MTILEHVADTPLAIPRRYIKIREMDTATPTLCRGQSQVSPAATIRLTNKTRNTLAALAEYYCLRVKDLAAILRERDPNDSDTRSFNYTLSVLRQAGLVNRLPYLDLGRADGGIAYVYGLSDKGVKYVREFYDDRSKAFDHHSQRTLDHELEISLFHMALKRMCKAKGLTLYWQQDDLKCTVNPDAMFAITNPSKPEGQNTLYYFLEIERAKLGHYQNGESSIMRKLGAYYAYYDTPKCSKEWQFSRFRVIVIQSSPIRRANLLKELNKTHNHRMFWLTTESLYQNYLDGQIFSTPKDYLERSYSLSDI
jgi:DNA-binding transcriptional ArsR family regulator